jgi:RNA polymerase sigma-70 factor, ECF subfamily
MTQALDRDDAAIVSALRAGDEQMFCDLVARWSGPMLRLALAHIGSRAIAEEVVQEAWLTVLGTLDRFEGRSALRTWVLGIVVNIARSRGRKECRTVPLPFELDDRAVDQARFLPADHPRWPHHWATEPVMWTTPEDQLLAGETARVIADAIDALPAVQREVLVLRDVEGLSGPEACNVLGLTDTNQRVLLHRARSQVRSAIERYLTGVKTP